jgi:cobyrinic acid a,c-diamide synthase
VLRGSKSASPGQAIVSQARLLTGPTGRLGPRLVVAGTHSGVGKTTVATGLLAALRHAGHQPAGAKVGPDFIDPGYHALASGHPPRNLDAWLCGTEAVAPLAGRANDGADVLIVEGVMGLFDGAGDGSPSSTADVAKLLDAPVLLVVDASSLSGSVAALVAGYANHDPDLRVAGVILNRVGSDGHETLLREALVPLGIPVLGALRRDEQLTWRDRHLGLVPVAEQSEGVIAALERLAGAISERIDLPAVVELARTAPPRHVGGVALPPRVVPQGQRVTVAVAAGVAFTFTYQDTLDALVAAGADPVPFDPRLDPELPEGTAGLLAGGGFPEVHVAELSANQPLMAEVRCRADRGMPIWAECGGLLWLCRTLDGAPMADVVPAHARMVDRLTLGYRTARARRASPVTPANGVLRGHEFHYSTVTPQGSALDLSARWGTRGDGFANPNLLATYLHVHPGADPRPIARFVQACLAAPELHPSHNAGAPHPAPA